MKITQMRARMRLEAKLGLPTFLTLTLKILSNKCMSRELKSKRKKKEKDKKKSGLGVKRKKKKGKRIGAQSNNL